MGKKHAKWVTLCALRYTIQHRNKFFVWISFLSILSAVNYQTLCQHIRTRFHLEVTQSSQLNCVLHLFLRQQIITDGTGDRPD